MIRQPAVANQFYPGERATLIAELERLVTKSESPVQLKGIVAPHAGYIYSGSIAGKIYGMIKAPDTVLILGPNHHGTGNPVAIYPDGEWITPLGNLQINEELNRLIKEHAGFAVFDSVAHRYEHSLEVQAPFIRYLWPEAKISAICIGFFDYCMVEEMGRGIARAIDESNEEILIVASSDMTHYESAKNALMKDELALERLLALDPAGLLNTCRIKGITMCGVVPAAVMLVAANELGAMNARLVSYGTSGDVTGDNSRVVSYASVAIW